MLGLRHPRLLSIIITTATDSMAHLTGWVKDTDMKVGDTIDYWVSGRPDGVCTILDIQPYAGKYKDLFTLVVKLSAANTRKGYIEAAFGPQLYFR